MFPGPEKVASAVSIPGRRFTVCEFVITSVALTVAQLGGCPPPALVARFFWFNSISHATSSYAWPRHLCMCERTACEFQSRVVPKQAVWFSGPDCRPTGGVRGGAPPGTCCPWFNSISHATSSYAWPRHKLIHVPHSPKPFPTARHCTLP